MALDLKKRLKGTLGDKQGSGKVSETRERAGKAYVEGAKQAGDAIGGESLGQVTGGINQTQVDLAKRRPKIIK